MPRFKPTNYQQTELIAVNFEDQLQPGTFEFAIHYLIDKKLDLTCFHARYRNDDTGRMAYDPAVLLKIVLFAYSKGITSSREIEWCCRYNILFKALSCNTVPHFTTIAAFISEQPEQIENVFSQVLLVCHEQNLLGNELFAIDGCKMSSNAAKEWSGTFEELKEKRAKLKKLTSHYIMKHRETDQRETKDEEQKQRLEKTIATLEKNFTKIDEFIKQNAPRMGKGKQPTEVKSNITDNESAKMSTSKGTIQGYNGVATVDQKHQIIVDAQAFGEGQEHHVLQPVLEKVKKTFDVLGISEDIFGEGVKVTADTGYANEANMAYLHDNEIDAYIPDNQFRSRDPKFAHQKEKYGKRNQDQPTKPQVIPPSEFQVDVENKRCICPAGEEMFLKNEGVDKRGNKKLFFEGRMSKCRQCERKATCMKNPEAADTREGHGRQVSFIIEKRPGKPNHTEWMKARIDSEEGRAIYSQRMAVVEPVFANIEANKGLKRFSLRGKKKVQGQWQLYCLVHNIEKLMNYGNIK